MRVLIVLFVLPFLFASCSKNEADFVDETESTNLESIINVQLIDDENNEVTTDYLKAKWESELAAEGDVLELGKFEVITSSLEDGTPTYFLKVVSTDGTLETGAFMVKNEGGLLSATSYTLKAKTCSCKGCSSGCNLTVSGSSCYCSNCPPWGNQSCIKTETIIINEQ